MKVPCVLISLLAALSSIHSLPHGYVRNKELGLGYKLMYQSKTWPEAKDSCERDGGQLAVPRSYEEFAYVQKLIRAMHTPSITGTDYKLLLWLGINNIENYKVWKNINGEDIEVAGFHRWAGDNGKSFSDNPEEPHCAGMDAINPGLRDFWCHRRQPYICQINL